MIDHLLIRARSIAQLSPIDIDLWNALEDDVLAYHDRNALMEFAATAPDAAGAMVLLTMLENGSEVI